MYLIRQLSFPNLSQIRVLFPMPSVAGVIFCFPTGSGAGSQPLVDNHTHRKSDNQAVVTGPA